jgi:A/G-specific adenine glycosylase
MTGCEDRPDDAAWFQRTVRAWSEAHRRAFPWRRETDPFHILIAEVMLRRTRAEQVVPVFERFLVRFPNPGALAEAPEADVEELVRPLGLRWRVPVFQQLARALVERHGGQVPSDPTQLRALPGVGDYVAAAVCIFAFGRVATLADTNTVRVAARYAGALYHAESRRNAGMRARIDRLVSSACPAASARALLDFAAVVCQARAPRCPECPVAARCHYFRDQTFATQNADGGDLA